MALCAQGLFFQNQSEVSVNFFCFEVALKVYREVGHEFERGRVQQYGHGAFVVARCIDIIGELLHAGDNDEHDNDARCDEQ